MTEPVPDPVPAGPMIDRELGAALSALPVPDHAPDFWPELGRRLLAEQEAPAAPTIDPSARLADHRGEPVIDVVPPLPTVEVLAQQAELVRPRPNRRRRVVVAVVVVAVAAAVAVAVAIGVNGNQRPLGTTADQVADRVAATVGADHYIEADVSVRAAGGTVERYHLTRSVDGSFRLKGSNLFADVSYDAASGDARSMMVRPAAGSIPASVEATEAKGLSPGPPDQAHGSAVLARDPVAAALLDLRRAGGSLVHLHTRHGKLVWVVDASFHPGSGSPVNRTRVVVDHTSLLPLEVIDYAGATMVRDQRITGIRGVATVASDAFVTPLPDGSPPNATDDSFERVQLTAVEQLNPAAVATPNWLPPGFELDQVTARPAIASPPLATAGGANPADQGLVTLTYRAGAALITITSRDDGGAAARWVDPFGSGAALPGTRSVRLDTGRFHGVTVFEVGAGGAGPSHLWGRGDGRVFTVAGDASPATLTRIAASLT